jgi:hypothetical protein
MLGCPLQIAYLCLQPCGIRRQFGALAVIVLRLR